MRASGSIVPVKHGMRISTKSNVTVELMDAIVTRKEHLAMVGVTGRQRIDLTISVGKKSMHGTL